MGEFEIAAKLGVPARELPDQPMGLIRAASVLLEAENIANRQGSK